MAYLIFLTMTAFFAATVIDERLKSSRRPALLLVLLVLGQIAVGAVVVRTGLYYMTTALHLAVALGILSVLASLWIGEARVKEISP